MSFTARTFYAAAPAQDKMLPPGVEHSVCYLRRGKRGGLHHPHFFFHALLSDKFLLPRDSIRKLGVPGSVTVMGLALMQGSTKSGGKPTAPNRSDFRAFL